MILTDREIRIAVERKAIIIDPPPPLSSYSSTSVDLTLDATVNIFKDPSTGLNITIDPVPGFNPELLLPQIAEQATISKDGYPLKPHTLVLAWTEEYVDLRNSVWLAARVEGKSSLARIGLGVHVTAPTVHAGFNGRIRLEIVNHGAFPIMLRKGMKICQLIFEQTLGTPDKGYAGRFSGQT